MRWFVAILALAWACTEGTIPEVDGGAEAGLVGQVSGGGGIDGGLPPPLPPDGTDGGFRPADPDAGGPPPPPPPPGGCNPGERLGLCAVCGQNGQPTTAPDDDQCGAIDCNQGAMYARADEGDVAVCVATRRAAGMGGRCAAPNRCRTPDEFCGAETTEEAARVDPGCQRMNGCVGAQPPVLEDLPPGSACNRFGTCGGGMCSVGPECAVFAAAVRFCRTGDDLGEVFCEFFVNADNGGRTCNQFCAMYGARCLRAWGDRDDTCEYNGDSNCDDEHNDHICRCSGAP